MKPASVERSCAPAKSMGGFPAGFSARRQRHAFSTPAADGRQNRRVPGRRRRGLPQFGPAPSDRQFPAHDRDHPGRSAARVAQLRLSKHRRCLRLLPLGPALAARGRHYRRTSSSATVFPARRWNDLAWNRERGCDTVAGLERDRPQRRDQGAGRGIPRAYEQSLDEAAGKVMARLKAGRPRCA